jgi:hypothetical protein
VSSDKTQREEFEDSCRLHQATFPELEGAASLVRLYDGVPSFHDAEITDLNLRQAGGSSIRLCNLYPTAVDDGRVFVTIEIAHLIDVELDGYNHGQNVINALHVRPARSNAVRDTYRVEPGDLEIELFSILGLGGLLVGRGLKVGWTMDRRARNASKRPALLGQ